MTYFASLFSNSAFIDLPQQPAGWIGFILLSALLVRGLSITSDVPFKLLTLKGGLLALLTFTIPLTSLSFGIQPDLLVTGLGDDYSTVILVMSALPWVIAADLLGVLPSVMLAVVSGAFFAFWGTHSLFTPVETGLAALIFNLILHQKNMPDYRPLTSHPFMAGVGAGGFMLLMMMAAGFFAVDGGLAARLDNALVSVWQLWLARIAELFIAVLLAEMLHLVLKRVEPAAIPSGAARPEKPVVRVPQKFTGTTFLIAFLLFVFVTLDWIIATGTAVNLLKDGREPQARITAKALVNFYQSGQVTVDRLAQANPLQVSKDELPNLFNAEMATQPGLHQFYLLDAAGDMYFAYPALTESDAGISPEEWNWLDAATAGDKSTSMTLKPRSGGSSMVTAFAAEITPADGSTIGIVVAHADFTSLFFSQAGLEISTFQDEETWFWQLVDENGNLVASADPGEITAVLDDSFRNQKPTFSFQIEDTPWELWYFAPREILQATAFQIAAPQMGLLILLGMTALVLVQNNTRRVSKIIRSISTDAARSGSQRSKNAAPRYDQHDEIERLKGAFEEMNNSLNDRLEELNRLLSVSQKIASSLQVEENMRAILEAALVSRVGSARILLDDLTTVEVEARSQVQMGSGELSGDYAYLDDQIYELMRYQDVLVVRNTLRIRRIEMPDGEKHPGALVAFAINHEGHYHGTLWVAYEEPYDIPDEEIRYLQMLAGDASIAAANYHLFTSAEIGRQRLEAVLAATPEPVLVLDASDRLLLLNPAAIVLPGLVSDSAPGQKIQAILLSEDLLTVLKDHQGDQVTTSEIKLENGRVYHVSVSSIISDGQVAGKVCNLRDITHYKETDSLKSDFVATVSHDLRSPLSLMRGWTTMMTMVGELNEQQAGYSEKIMAGISDMERLVNNVLDLEKIELSRGLKREKIIASELLDHVVETLQLQANQKKIDVSYEQEINPGITLEGDRDLLHLALINLLDNAIKFTPVGGKVLLDAKVEEGNLLFSVKDDGIGIAPLDQPKLFDRYFRSNRREAVQQRGSGLGLTIVKSIAELHKGRVWVESQLGKGSSFFLEIPR
jgi:two-component system phosphate regulon sensor histidine kinase PhoR